MADSKIVNIWNNLRSVGTLLTKGPTAFHNQFGTTGDLHGHGGVHRHLFTFSYDGEKNLGEIGPPKNYRPDFQILRIRSWQSYLENEVSQTIVKKFALWVVGSGLKLQAEPIAKVLESENINLNTEDFNDTVEARFNLFANSKTSDYSQTGTVHQKAKEAFINAIVGGDVLVVLRFDGTMTCQLIDGAHILTPFIGHSFIQEAKTRGNRIIDGVEIDEKGIQVAFYVLKSFNKFERIPVKGDSNHLTFAFLVYGLRYRIDFQRGMPLISVVLETLKKMERYKEAVVGSAEERAKIIFSIQHNRDSTGENPMLNNMVKAFDHDGHTGEDLPKDDANNLLANTMAATTNKQIFNLPIGAELKALESKTELQFKDFYGVNVDLIAAALEIPPEVAMSKYNSNFSASRAALKDWEHTLNVTRKDFALTFYQNIYNFWLEIQILQNKVSAPGYLKAVQDNNLDVLESYRHARFVGASVPHIDPVKEVAAERLKLGDSAKDIPLTTAEAATERLNGGDVESNMEQYSKELAKSKELEIVSPESAPETIPPPPED